MLSPLVGLARRKKKSATDVQSWNQSLVFQGEEAEGKAGMQFTPERGKSDALIWIYNKQRD